MNIKTTVAGIFTIIMGILAFFHVVIPADIATLLGAIGGGLTGYFAKDANPIANTKE